MENHKIRQRVLKNYVAFVGGVDPDLLSDHLKQESIISIEQWQDICGKNTGLRSRCRGLLDFLLTGNDPRAFLVVRDVLKENDHYLLNVIDEDSNSCLAEETKAARQSLFQMRTGYSLQEDIHERRPTEDCDLTSDRRNKQILLSELRNENDLLRKEIENERTEKKRLQSIIEQQRIIATKEAHALREELIKEKVIYKAYIEKLKQELDNNRVTTNNEPQVSNDKLRQELDVEKATNNSLQDNNDKLKQELDTEKAINNSLQVSYDKLLKELDRDKATPKTVEANSERLLPKLGSWNSGEQRYKSDPVLVQAIRTKVAKEKNKAIAGLTIVEKELFVVHCESSEVEVYDSIKFSFSRRWNLKDLIDPWYIVSCIRNRCLYIFNFNGFMNHSKAILRVDPNGNVIRNWSTGDGYGRLSVTNEFTVILASYGQNKLNEYSPEGRLIREIHLSISGIRSPWHAIKLANGHFVVSHGDDVGAVDDGLHRVCIVDGDGTLKKSFDGKCGPTFGELNRPLYLSVDGNGFVMVADLFNGRVLLLDPDLEFRREILSKEKHGLRVPQRILLDESNGRLFVADNEANNERILVFDL